MSKITLGLIIFIVLFLAVSFIYYFSKEREVSPSLPKTEIPPETPKFTLPKILYNLAGVIQKLEKEIISLEATVPQLDEAGQPIGKTETRKVKISEFTKLSRLTFVETQPGRKAPKETPITFRDLKTGDYIDVISNQDISQAEEFEATQIRVLPR